MGTPDEDPLPREIADAVRLATPDPERVAALCARLRAALHEPPEPAPLLALAPVLTERGGAAAAPVFDLLTSLAPRLADPWPLCVALLRSRDPRFAVRALGLLAEVAGDGRPPGDDALRLLSERADAEGDPLGTPEALRVVARLMVSPEAVLFSRRDFAVRRLAARVLDLSGEPTPPETARRFLGEEAAAFFAPYLAYTRAGHLDLLRLRPDPDAPPPALDPFRRAEAECGADLLRALVAETGWGRVNLSVAARRQAGFSVAGSVPLFVPPAAASLLAGLPGVRETGECVVVLAHGGEGPPGTAPGAAAGPVAMFRALNLRHAELLERILSLEPLTRATVEAILASMTRVVADFAALFSAHSAECRILPEVFGDLEGRIRAELAREGGGPSLSPELTRLVNAFEDPPNLGAVRTLHGLKRYLHQRGLRLGFRLFAAGPAPPRSVDIAVASGGALTVLRCIRYADFEGEGDGREIPWAVRLVAEGFARQAVHGQRKFPQADVFCYGNEVHYYLSFRNHPAFLRVDFSPPLKGGMIDLEYYGVSNYEATVHPAPTLPALREFFAALGFFATVDGTHVHARADKESLVDLAALCEHAETMFRLAPYLMDLDWIVGSLSLAEEARLTVARAWAGSFGRWGALPLRLLLTSDRRGVVAGIETGPLGEREVAWSGDGEYHDRLSAPPPEGFFERLEGFFAGLGLPFPPLTAADRTRSLGQVRLEEGLLAPLVSAMECGAIVATPAGLRRRPAQEFEEVHEAVAFARLLTEGEAVAAAAAEVARLVAPIARGLPLRTTGHVAGREVQRAPLRLRGERLTLFALRDEAGRIRLAFYAEGDLLFRRREGPAEPWRMNRSLRADDLARRLRRNGFLSTEPAPTQAEALLEGRAMRREIAAGEVPREPGPLPGERLLPGLEAAPGRAVGRVVFLSDGRRPEDFDGAVLVAPALRPEDNTALYHAAGVLTTGGGVLSHAGLLALQFHKPALVVEGRWDRAADGSVSLLFSLPEYREETVRENGLSVVVRRDRHEREHRLSEGDLVVLNADAGTLRVLGQDRDALALAEGLSGLSRAARSLAATTTDAQTLVLMGRRLRARHQVEKVLSRLEDRNLARFAAREFILGEIGESGAPADRDALLTLLAANPRVGTAAADCARDTAGLLAGRARDAAARALAGLPATRNLCEVLAPRLRAHRLARALGSVRTALEAAGLPPPERAPDGLDVLDAAARQRLLALRAEAAAGLVPGDLSRPDLRHRLRAIERIDAALGRSGADGGDPSRLAAELDARDAARREAVAGRLILTAADGGLELAPLMGHKAANLAEIARLSPDGAAVPPWFAVTDAAFRRVYEGPRPPPGRGTLRGAVEEVLARADLGRAEKSAAIRALWDAAELPPDLAEAIREAWAGLRRSPGEERPPEEGDGPPFAAIRSSSREEDAEAAARAGEFETFLFVRGEESLLAHLRRAWSGLWTERAIHNRAVLGTGDGPGGGVLVQRIAWARVAGVLQTVDVARGEHGDVVINAGLGLGEGVVSGAVAADHLTVGKDSDIAGGHLRMTYVTADKRERVIFDRRRGAGTVRAETLYHQRLRSALEYVEILELVRAGLSLEAAYRHPVDVEFAIEGARLLLLQVRPVPVVLPALRETLSLFPLREGKP